MVTLYSKSNCKFCERAKDCLVNANIGFETVTLDDDRNLQEFKRKYPYQRTVPLAECDRVVLGSYKLIKEWASNNKKPKRENWQ